MGFQGFVVPYHIESKFLSIQLFFYFYVSDVDIPGTKYSII